MNNNKIIKIISVISICIALILGMTTLIKTKQYTEVKYVLAEKEEDELKEKEKNKEEYGDIIYAYNDISTKLSEYVTNISNVIGNKKYLSSLTENNKNSIVDELMKIQKLAKKIDKMDKPEGSENLVIYNNMLKMSKSLDMYVIYFGYALDTENINILNKATEEVNKIATIKDEINNIINKEA